METKVNYAIVGGFVLTLFAAFIFAVIWLSSGFKVTQNKTYEIDMNESVSGLSLQSPVEFNGVNVGSVTSIQINHNDPEVVEILIAINATTPVSVGTIATLKSRGITGITFIALTDKSDNREPLQTPKGRDYPVITAGPSLFTRIDTAVDELSKNLSRISNSIQSLLSPENQRSISNILLHLDRVTGVLSLNSQRLNTILINASKSSEQLNPLLTSSAGTARMLETQTLPAMFKLLNNLDNASRALNEMTQDIKQNPAILIRGAPEPTLGPGETR